MTRLRTRTARTLGLWIAAILSALPTAAAPPRPTLDARALDATVLLEIEPLGSAARSRDALAAALQEINEIDALTRLDEGDLPLGTLPDDGLAALNRAAGRGPSPIDPRLAELLERALHYCRWSQRAHGPVGGRLYGLWGLRRETGSPPLHEADAAADSAGCDRLRVDRTAATATLDKGSVADAWGFARGYAVDRAITVLREHGVVSGWVQIGQVTRALGPGPVGAGWPMLANPKPGHEQLAERVLLQDRAIAMASLQAGSLRAGGEELPPYVDQRSGRPARQALAVLVVTELAVDAEALAGTLFVLPSREGEYRLGSLRPDPAVKWMLGAESSAPLVTEHGWAALPKWVQGERFPAPAYGR
ncbi:MAG TPA: FAD:protein FMN transferase [Thermoanaerobaculia bacterium]|nr:FAD:protein FMN transferase [Thermoanaerobaculia bacterium]